MASLDETFGSLMVTFENETRLKFEYVSILQTKKEYHLRNWVFVSKILQVKIEVNRNEAIYLSLTEDFTGMDPLVLTRVPGYSFKKDVFLAIGVRDIANVP